MRKFYALLTVFLVACGGSDAPVVSSPTPVDIDQQAKITTTSAISFHVGIKERFSQDLTDTVTSIFLDGELLFQTGNIDLQVLNSCGGNKHITGSLDESTSTGTLNITFTDYQYCVFGGMVIETFSGEITVTISNTETYVPGGNITIPSDYIVTTSNLLVATNSFSFTMDGAIEYNHDTSDPDFNTITLIKNIDFTNSDGTASFINFVFQKHYSPKDIETVSGYWSYSYTGRLYDSDFGYVDVSTTNATAACATPIYPSLCPLDPTAAGKVVMTGDTSNAQITFTDNLDRLSIDSDDDSVFEQEFFCTNDGECQ